MDHKSFTAHLVKSTGLSREQVAEASKALIAALSASMASLDSISIDSLGTFAGVKEDEKTVNDISTGEKILLPPVIEAKFTPSDRLKSSLS